MSTSLTQIDTVRSTYIIHMVTINQICTTDNTKTKKKGKKQAYSKENHQTTMEQKREERKNNYNFHPLTWETIKWK